VADTPHVGISSFGNRREVAAKVADADFMETVLEPCGYHPEQGVTKLHKHFRIQEFPGP